MAKLRKKPVIVDAFFITSHMMVRDEFNGDEFDLKRDSKAKPGMVLIRGTHNEMYPIRWETFLAVYEPADEAAEKEVEEWKRLRKDMKLDEYKNNLE